jgi:cysteine desulfurase
MAVIACDRAGLAVSSGSSCASGAQRPSGVLAAMGVSGEGAVRFSLGWTTTEADMERALDIFVDVVRRLRR